MSFIKIIAVPPGFAPDHIRQQWVGVQIPLATEVELRDNSPSGFKIGNQNNGGHIVLREKAIEALHAAGKVDAVNFWTSTPVISIASYLEFRRDVCELVE